MQGYAVDRRDYQIARFKGFRNVCYLRLSRLKAGRFLEACQLFLVPAREARLLLDVDKTFGQTRSGTGNTHALGQDLPRIRALDGGLSCCSAVASPHSPRWPGQEREARSEDADAPPEMLSTGHAVLAQCHRDTHASAARAVS